MEQLYMFPILYCQYDACWCPGSLSRRRISRHCIDQRSRNILSLASEELMIHTVQPPYNSDIFFQNIDEDIL